MSNIIEFRGVAKNYRRGPATVIALNNVTFELEAGKSMVLMGPSGSGKSTFLQLAGGLDKPTSGEVLVNGQDLKNLRDYELSKFRNQTIGFVFQFFNLQDYYTAIENAALPAILAGKSEQEAFKRAEELLTEMGLAERMKHKPTELSGGEMQRVAIARALINEPKLIIADEPTGNLDKESAATVLSHFEKIAKRGVSLVLATHDERVCERFPRVVKMEDGAIKQ